MTHSVTWKAIFHHWHFKRKIQLAGQRTSFPPTTITGLIKVGEKNWPMEFSAVMFFSLSGLNALSEIKLLYECRK